MRTIYNKETGKPKTLDAVDAYEHIETGRWQADPVEQPGLPLEESTFDEQYINSVHQNEAEENKDPTSAEAYAERQEAFEVSASEKQEQIDGVEEEITKAKKGRK